MPVLSTRRYSSSSYVSPSSSSISSSIGSYRSSYSSSLSSSKSSSLSKDLPSSSSYSSDLGYRSYRTGSLTSSGTSGSYRSRYDFDDLDKRGSSISSSSSNGSSALSTRIGVSKSISGSSSYHSSRLPPLPPSSSSSSSSSSTFTRHQNISHNYGTSSRSLSRDNTDSGDVKRNGTTKNSKLNNDTSPSSSILSDLDFYEKYSPSRYMTKYELLRSKSLSEANPSSNSNDTSSTNNNKNNSTTNNINNNNENSLTDTSTHTPQHEIRSVALRNTLPSTTSTKTWDRDYTSSYYRTPLSDSKREKNETRNSLSGSSYAAGGYRASNISPSKSPSRDSIYDRKTSALVEGQCGLWNIGNTCFMNSVLQCLSHTNDLSKYARSPSALPTSTNKSSTSLSKDLQIWNEFCKLIQQMWQPGAKSINPSELKMALSSKYRMYSGSAQQDAQEFLRYILDALHGALNLGGKKVSLHVDDEMSDLEKANVMWEWYTNRENSVIKDLFVGQLKSSLYCCHCEKTSVMYDPFWDLSVPVPSTPNCKLDKCLELFTVKDVLDGNEMPYCDFCKTNRKCIKGFTIQRFPKYLVIHLKRFSEMRWTKLTNIVEFPISKLDLTPYASESMEKSDPPPIYTLYGISNHMGSTHGGHYVASCKHPVNKKWFEYNDNFVSEISESSLVTSSAYLLFYERM